MMISRREKSMGWIQRITWISEKPGLALFLFFFAFYYFTNAGWFKGGDEAFMIKVAEQVAAKAQIGFSKEELPEAEHPVGRYDIARSANGLYYVKWGLGQSLVEVPLLWIHQALFTPTLPDRADQREIHARAASKFMTLIICPSALSALGCVLVYLFALRLNYSKRLSILLSLLYGLTTMVWPYSKSFMSEATLNVAILGGVYTAWRYVSKPSKAMLAVAGACLGFALITKVMSVLIAVVVVFYVLVASPRKATMRDLVLFFAPPFLAFLGIQAWQNFIRYGDIWQFGYGSGRGAMGFCTPLYAGLWGLFLSPGKSFFLYTPLAILSLLSLRCFFHKNKAEAFLFLSIVIIYTLPHARWCLWAGDWAWGPRFLLVIIPYLILPCGRFFEKWNRKSRVARKAVIVLITFSLAIQVLGSTIHPFSFIVTRVGVLNVLISPNLARFSYADSYTENALVNFSPMFSHIVGNWWLLKHMFLNYDLWSDTPWRAIGAFDLKTPMWVRGDRTIPFWWPVGIPWISPSAIRWVFPLAAANLLVVFWFAIRVGRFLRGKRQ
jgi:hypothetical protein